MADRLHGGVLPLDDIDTAIGDMNDLDDDDDEDGGGDVTVLRMRRILARLYTAVA
jgi:hypothetical protein